MNINRVVLTGNLTADPEVRPRRAARRSRGFAWRSTPDGGTARPASGRRSPTTSTSPCGERRPRTARRYLAKGRPVAVDGRLEWREYTTQDGRSARRSR